MATATRIYKVTITNHGKTSERLVKSPTAAQAISHVRKEMIDAEVASQDDMVRLLGASVKVEEVTE